LVDDTKIACSSGTESIRISRRLACHSRVTRSSLVAPPAPIARSASNSTSSSSRDTFAGILIARMPSRKKMKGICSSPADAAASSGRLFNWGRITGSSSRKHSVGVKCSVQPRFSRTRRSSVSSDCARAWMTSEFSSL
jgi:hypothetical protein